MYGYIYRTTNLENGMWYIGMHRSEVFDPLYLGSGKHLKRALKKYKEQSFKCEIIEQCNNEESLTQREIYWIMITDAVNSPSSYNLNHGGRGGNHSEDVKRRIGNVRRGKKHTIESRIKMSQAHTGTKRSLTSRMNQSKATTGRKRTEEQERNRFAALAKVRHIIAASNTGKKRTEETKAKMRAKWLERPPVSEETRRKMSESAKKRYSS